jgi:predicted DNA-binding transcriptional regulator AlpA
MSSPANPTPKLLNVNEAAERLGVSASYLNKLRLSGDGPVFLKLGTRVAYDPDDLATWLSERKRLSTSGAGRVAPP